MRVNENSLTRSRECTHTRRFVSREGRLVLDIFFFFSSFLYFLFVFFSFFFLSFSLFSAPLPRANLTSIDRCIIIIIIDKILNTLLAARDKWRRYRANRRIVSFLSRTHIRTHTHTRIYSLSLFSLVFLFRSFLRNAALQLYRGNRNARWLIFDYVSMLSFSFSLSFSLTHTIFATHVSLSFTLLVFSIDPLSIFTRSEMRRIKERGEKGRRGGGKSRFEVSRAGRMLCKAFRALPRVRFDEKVYVYASHIARKKRI